jgi:L-asparaginase / beta-aspartyl-peptidase
MCSSNHSQRRENRIGFAVHGGAGTISRKDMTPELEKAYRAKLEEAVLSGYSVLEKGGTSLQAIERAIIILEDSPLFNAGHGAVFTSAGTNELDASIMDGRTLGAGAVCAVRRIKNPIILARYVMERSPHVIMVGEGAEEFAKQQGMGFVDPAYFHTEKRWKDLERARELEKKRKESKERKFGTVGAVALDRDGNLAAGTSTGGMTNKRFGRVGDSAIIGAGTYANNSTCALSATGHGEYFIRASVTHDISALMEYRQMSLKDAADLVINRKLKQMGGDGGVIGIDRKGNIAMPFNTTGMYRAYINEQGRAVTAIFN